MKFNIKHFHRYLLGKPRNPLNPETRRHIALIAFFAWIGVGADGLSSSCYGPEEAFLALGQHTHLSLYLAIATALTVFIIAAAYNQVIELFPNGGGGYKVSSQLIGPYAGLVAGSALIVDYVLTITISIASAVDALFSLLPLAFQAHKLGVSAGLIILLCILNLRGMKESIKVLMPIFLGFVISHVCLIVYGVATQINAIPSLVTQTWQETHALASSSSWAFVLALFLRAYSLGGGTYTGLEAVSNNVNQLAEPRAKTGKWTMLYMALSLSLTAGGIILLYLLWNVTPTPGQTLNASVFRQIIGEWQFSQPVLLVVLALEAGLLFVGANTGFLGGPSVLANMALDQWIPNRFLHLSSRLVTQNGVILFGLASLAILIVSEGKVSWLVILYSINVFLTFSLAILGLCIYWWKHRRVQVNWRGRLTLSLVGFVVSSSILLITLIEKFTDGGWVTVLVTSAVIGMCVLTHRHYQRIANKLSALNALLPPLVENLDTQCFPLLDPSQPTAAFMVDKNRGVTMHTLLWAQRMFPGHFKNFIFMSTGVVDVQSFGGQNNLEQMQKETDATLHYFVQYCHQHHQAASSFDDYGTDPVKLLSHRAEKIHCEFPNTIFFASKLIFSKDNWIMRFLHNETAFAIQRKLHLKEIQLIILPLRIQSRVKKHAV
jgi:hypothetical protein